MMAQDEVSPLPEPQRPTPDPSSLVPADQIAAVMQMQAEVLRRIDERQERIEDQVKDQRRSEMMISSTRSLNESFQGMRQVQEGLLERLRGEGGQGRRTIIIAFCFLFVLLVGAGIWIFQLYGRELRRDPGDAPIVQDMRKGIAALQERLQDVETFDREGMLDQLKELQVSLAQIEAQRELVRGERDRAQRELEELRSGRQGLVSERDELRREKEKLAALAEERREEIARLTSRQLAQQQTIAKLNDLIARTGERPAGVSKRSPAKEPSTVATNRPAPASGTGERSAGPAAAADPVSLEAALAAARAAAGGNPVPEPPQPRPGSAPQEETPAPAAAAAKAAAEAAPAKAFPPERLLRLNELLSVHRGSDRYALLSAASIQDGALQGVELQVRAADGRVEKTIEAERLMIDLSSRGDKLELRFRTGYVTYHTRLRNIKSPFGHDAYTVVVIGIDREAWLKESFPFLRVD